MKHGLFGLLVFMSACLPELGALEMTQYDVECEIMGKAHPRVSSADICAQFLRAVEESGRKDIARIDISTPSSTSAKVLATDKNGTVVADLDFDIMDAKMNSGAWRNFGDAFARHLANNR